MKWDSTWKSIFSTVYIIIGNSPGHLNSSLHRLFYIYICSSFKPDNLHNGRTKLRLQGTFRFKDTLPTNDGGIFGVGVFTKI